MRRNQPCCFHRDRSLAAARRSILSVRDAISTDTTSFAARSTAASRARWAGSEVFSRSMAIRLYTQFTLYENFMHKNIAIADSRPKTNCAQLASTELILTENEDHGVRDFCWYPQHSTPTSLRVSFLLS